MKPGIRCIAIERSKELNQEHRGTLNLLLIKQAYFMKKVRSDLNNITFQAELKQVQIQICNWYETQSKKFRTNLGLKSSYHLKVPEFTITRYIRRAFYVAL